MSKTLEQERESWEGRENTTLVTHFKLKHRDANISILVESALDANKQGPVMYYDMIRYFKIGDDWVTSCDVRSGSAEDVFRKIAEVI